MSALAVALAVAGCAPASAPLPRHPLPAGPGVVVDAAPVPMDPTDAAHVAIGAFSYAGGVVLTSAQTSRLHGLSDLKVWPDGRLLAVGDQGDLLEARLVLDHAGHLAGLADARLTPLIGEDGQPITQSGRDEYDAEGIAEFPNGDRLVSLEHHDRILLYPHRGGPPRQAPMPEVKFQSNKGMEALAVYPHAGADAYLVGVEATGETWVCHLQAACVPDQRLALGDFELSAVQPLEGDRRAYLLRAYDPLRGVRIILKIIDAKGVEIDRLELGRPLTVDNFEGVATAPSPNGGLRFYLISDDNFSGDQRTLLLAFDWRPTTGRRP